MYSPIFIVGAPRSGTTLTAKIIGNHSKIFMPGETPFFEDIYSRRKEWGEKINSETAKIILARLSNIYHRYNEPNDQKRIDYLFSNKQKLKFMVSSWKSYRDIIVSFMEIQMRYEGKSRWGNNLPRDIFNYKNLLQFFPNSKIIICVRDPRDFLLSYKNKWRITSPDNVNNLRNLYHPIVTSFLWKASIRLIPVIRRNIYNGKIFILYYEELVNNPIKSVKKICKFIHEDFEHNMLNVQNPNSSHGISQNGIFSSSVNRWKNQLSNEEVFISQQILRTEMKTHGYKIYKIKINYIKLIKIILYFPFVLARGINSRNGIRGPLLPYLSRRLSTLVFKFK